MATNKRTVSFTVDANVLGTDGVSRLARDVRSLAKDGGDAAPVFEELAQAIERVGEQGDAIAKVQRLEAEVDQLAATSREAAAAELALAERMNTTAQTADTARSKLQAAREEEARLKSERQAQELALARLQATTQGAARDNDLYRLRVRDLRLEILNLKEQEQAAATARRQATAEARSATAAGAALATQVKKTAEETTKTNDALSTRSAALKEAQIAAGQLGIDTQNLSAEQIRLGQALQQTASAAAAQLSAVEDLAAQEAEALRIQEAFAQAVKVADAAMAEQVATLKSTERAIESYNVAQTESISLGEKDVAANERRLAAARDLIRSDEQLSAAQRQLANTRDQSRAATLREAQALLDVAAAAKQSLAATQQLVSEAQSAGRIINEAFAATGVRSLQAIEAEIHQTESALSLLERRFKAGAISAQDLDRATAGAQVRLAGLIKEAQTIPSAPGVFERINGQVLGLINRFGALSAAIATVTLAFKPLVENEVELQRLNRVLTTLTGSQEKTAQTIEFLRNASQAAGQSFTETAGAYTKFAAAAVNSGIPLEQVNSIFQRTANAAGNLGLSTDDTSRILTALGQIASKGVVSMEELRQQLGDAMPGALQLTAKALGLTSSELTKMIESGQLLARDGLPAIAKGMEELASKTGKIDGLVASWNRFKNIVSEAGTNLTSGPVGTAFGTLLGGIATGIEKIIVLADTASTRSIQAVQSVVTVLTAVVTGDFKNLGDALGQIADNANKHLEGLKGRVEGTGAAMQGAAAKSQTLAQATAAAGVAAQAQATSFTASVGAINAAAQASEQMAKAQAAAADAALKAKTNAEAGSQAWIRAQVDYTNAAAAAQIAATAADRLAQAKRSEGEALIATAELAGNEVFAQQARAKAATDSAAALRAQADADQALANVYASERDALLKLIEAQGGADEAQVKQLQTLKQTVESKQADAEKTNQQAAAAERLALSLQTQSLTLADNSKNLETYRDALERAREEQLRIDTLMRAGLATREQLAEATGKVAQFEALVKDALDDTTSALQRNITALRTKADIQLAGLEAQKSELEVEIQLLESQGRSYEALQKKIQLKELEIKIIQAKIEATLAEVKATRLEIEAERDAAEAAGTLTEAKKAELDARLAAIKVKEIEAQASKAQIALIEQQIENLRLYGNESAKAYSQSSQAIQRETVAIQQNTEAWTANGKARVDAQGFALNTEGQRVNAAGVDSNFAINQLKGYGFSDADAMNALRTAGILDANGQVHLRGYSSLAEAIQAVAKKYPNPQSLGPTSVTTTDAGAGSLVTKVTHNDNLSRATTPSAPATLNQPAATASPRVVNIHIGGVRTPVAVSDDASEANLVGVLKQLAEGSSRSV